MPEISDEDIKNIVNSLNVDDLKHEIVEEPDAYNLLLSKISSLAKHLKISDKVAKKLAEPDRIVETDIPVVLERKSQGKEIVKIFAGCWIEYSNILGQYQGNVNFTPNFKVEYAKINALITTLKNALLELPFGSASGGVTVNKSILVPKEIERIAKNYTNNLSRIVDLSNNILASGFGCDERMISLMYNTCKETAKEKSGISKTSFLGKMMQDGGIKARNSSIALGIFSIIDQALKGQEVSEIPGLQKHEDIIKKTAREIKVALIGFDAVEKELAFMLDDAGYKIIAISDSFGGAASSSGISPEEATRWQRNHTSVAGMPKTIKLSNEQMLQVKADLLITASNVNINNKNAHKIKAPLIIELQPVISPLTLEELSKSKIVVPYILASCPEAYANYLEFLQNKAEKYFDRKDIDKKIEDKAKETFKLVYKTSRAYGVNLHDACCILALQNIAKAFPIKK